MYDIGGGGVFADVGRRKSGGSLLVGGVFRSVEIASVSALERSGMCLHSGE